MHKADADCLGAARVRRFTVVNKLVEVCIAEHHWVEKALTGVIRLVGLCREYKGCCSVASRNFFHADYGDRTAWLRLIRLKAPLVWG